MRILAVINTYNCPDLPKFVTSNALGWSSQQLAEGIHVDVVFSDVVSSPKMRSDLVEFVNSKSKPNCVFHVVGHDTNVPVYVSFNLTVKHFMQQYFYDFFIYCSEDCIMSDCHDLSHIMSEFNNSASIGQVTALVDVDNTIWYKHYDKFKPNSPPFTIALGESINMHFSVWSRNFMEKYNFKYIDILTAYATESVYTFLHAAIDTKWVHCRKVKLSHRRSKKPKGYLGYSTFKNFRDIKDIFAPGMPLGLGFECWMGGLRPEKRKHWYPFRTKSYDKKGNCKNKTQLYEYIINNLFVPTSVFDYDKEVKNIKLLA